MLSPTISPLMSEAANTFLGHLLDAHPPLDLAGYAGADGPPGPDAGVG